MAIKPNIPNGPIPGENYTSNVKNYPWHRPPEITTMEKGIEAAITQLSSRTGAYGLLNSLQAGVTIVQAADMLVTSGIGKGKWSPDMALMLAGPVARMMEIMAKDAGIEYALGLDEEPIKTINVYKKQAELSKPKVDSAVEALKASEDVLKSMDTTTKPTKGFMTPMTDMNEESEIE